MFLPCLQKISLLRAKDTMCANGLVQAMFVYTGLKIDKRGVVNLLKVALTLFEACSASIAVRATDQIGIYESDNGRKGE